MNGFDYNLFIIQLFSKIGGQINITICRLLDRGKRGGGGISIYIC